jgi:methylenetetrahydrofolate reductase (NADPH)
MFVHKNVVENLVNFLSKFKGISYQAINMAGKEFKNVGEQEVNAVTWGVFTGKEIIQPTVVDHQAFKIWKDIAFKAWIDTWGVVYKAHEGYDGDQESFNFL